jgi:hypothetical protein
VVWILLAIGTICVVECFIRSPLLSKVKQLTGLLGKISGVLRSSSISDHWKEKILPVYAGKLLSSSIVLFFWVALGLLPMIVLVLVAEFFDSPLLPLVSSLLGLAASTLIALIYVYLRKRVLSA